MFLHKCATLYYPIYGTKVQHGTEFDTSKILRKLDLSQVVSTLWLLHRWLCFLFGCRVVSIADVWDSSDFAVARSCINLKRWQKDELKDWAAEYFGVNFLNNRQCSACNAWVSSTHRSSSPRSPPFLACRRTSLARSPWLRPGIWHWKVVRHRNRMWFSHTG